METIVKDLQETRETQETQEIKETQEVKSELEKEQEQKEELQQLEQENTEEIFTSINEEQLLKVIKGKQVQTSEIAQSEQESEEDKTLRDYVIFARTVVVLIDGLVVFGHYIYAKRKVETTFSEVKKIVGLTGEEKTEISRVLGRIFMKYGMVLSEEIQLGIILFRIYFINKYSEFSQWLKSKMEQGTTTRRRTSRKTSKKGTSKKGRKSVKDVLEEAKQ